jgi:hypothetical protein
VVLQATSPRIPCATFALQQNIDPIENGAAR